MGINLHGDKFAAAQYIGRAKSEMLILDRQDALCNLDNQLTGKKGLSFSGREVEPYPGVKIVCRKIFGSEFIDIYVDSVASSEGEEESGADMYNLLLLYYEPELSNKRTRAIAMGPASGLTAITSVTAPADCKYALFDYVQPLYSHLYNTNSAQAVYANAEASVAFLQWDEAVETDIGLDWYHVVRFDDIFGFTDFVFRQKKESSQVQTAISLDLKTIYLVLSSAMEGGVTWLKYRESGGVWSSTGGGFIPDDPELNYGKERVGNLAITREGRIYGWRVLGDTAPVSTLDTLINETSGCNETDACHTYQESISSSRKETTYYVFATETESFETVNSFSYGNVMSLSAIDMGFSKLVPEGGGEDGGYSLITTEYIMDGSCLSSSGLVACHSSVEQTMTGTTYSVNKSTFNIYLSNYGGLSQSFGVLFPSTTSYIDNRSSHTADIICQSSEYPIGITNMTYAEKLDAGTKTVTAEITRTSLAIRTARSATWLDETTYSSLAGNIFLSGCDIGLWGGQPGLSGDSVNENSFVLKYPINVSPLYEISNSFITCHNDIGLSFYGAKYSEAIGDDLKWSIYCKYNGVTRDITNDLRTEITNKIRQFYDEDFLSDAVEAIMDNISTIIFVKDRIQDMV